ncbi:MAG: hypothetical protein U0441_26390 [Polyangiaceae bacterium]
MFASLDRADARMSPEDGRTRLVLTDHRDAEEVEASRDLSILFAMIRVLRARRMDDTKPIVFYYAPGELPDFLVEAVKAAGGRVVIGEDPRAWTDITDRVSHPRDTITIVTEAMENLAHRVAREAGVPLDHAGLATFERTCLRSTLEDDEIDVDIDMDEDEEIPDEDEEEEEDSDESDGGVARWTAIVSVAAFASEILRNEVTSRWILDEDGSDSFPFRLECVAGNKEMAINLLGKGVKLRDNGIEDSLAFLVSTVLTLVRAAD